MNLTNQLKKIKLKHSEKKSGSQSARKKCNQCEEDKNKTYQMILINRQLFHKFSASQNYYYTKDINDIIANQRTSNIIKIKDFQFLDDEEEYLKRYYKVSEYDNKMIMLTEYYKYHNDIARLFMMPTTVTLNKFHDKKRRIEYIRITQIIQQEEQVKKPKNKIKNDKNLLNIAKDNHSQEKHFLPVLSNNILGELNLGQEKEKTNNKNQTQTSNNTIMDLNKKLTTICNQSAVLNIDVVNQSIQNLSNFLNHLKNNSTSETPSKIYDQQQQQPITVSTQRELRKPTPPPSNHHKQISITKSQQILPNPKKPQISRVDLLKSQQRTQLTETNSKESSQKTTLVPQEATKDIIKIQDQQAQLNLNLNTNSQQFPLDRKKNHLEHQINLTLNINFGQKPKNFGGYQDKLKLYQVQEGDFENGGKGKNNSPQVQSAREPKINVQETKMQPIQESQQQQTISLYPKKINEMDGKIKINRENSSNARKRVRSQTNINNDKDALQTIYLATEAQEQVKKASKIDNKNFIIHKKEPSINICQGKFQIQVSQKNPTHKRIKSSGGGDQQDLDSNNINTQQILRVVRNKISKSSHISKQTSSNHSLQQKDPKQIKNEPVKKNIFQTDLKKTASEFKISHKHTKSEQIQQANNALQAKREAYKKYYENGQFSGDFVYNSNIRQLIQNNHGEYQKVLGIKSDSKAIDMKRSHLKLN